MHARILIAGLITLAATANAATWNGADYAETKSVKGLPPYAAQALNADGTGTTGIAERGAKYNATDVMDTQKPSRRFLMAGVAGDRSIVALEQGGRGHHMDAFLVVDDPGGPVIKDQWKLDKAPKNLAELLDAVANYGKPGIRTKKDAERIAKEYFKLHVGCGTYGGVDENAKVWIVNGKFGFAGTPIEGFTIDKETGKITSPIGPSYADEAEMKRMRRHPLK